MGWSIPFRNYSFREIVGEMIKKMGAGVLGIWSDVWGVLLFMVVFRYLILCVATDVFSDLPGKTG